MPDHTDRQSYLEERLPTLLHELTHRLSMYTLAPTILNLHTREDRRNALENIPDEFCRAFVKMSVETLYRRRRGG